MRIKTAIFLSIFLFSSVSFSATYPQTFDERLYDAKIAAVLARIDAMDKAVGVKTEEMERRLEGLNELRKDVVKDREQFVRKEVYESKVKEYDEAVKRLANLESRLIAWASALVVVFALVNVGAHLWGLRRKTKGRYPEDDRSG